ncbi:MAG: hypothetical protein ABID38_06055 [Candidatus Diapherotrites archaeon]
MKYEKCGGNLKKFKVDVEDSDLPSEGFECTKCGELFFDEEKSKKVVEDLKRKEILKELPALSIKQKIVKLSKDRLGFYLNKDIARCTGLKAGEEIEVSLLDKKRILVKVE